MEKASSEYLLQQPVRFPLQGNDIGPDLFQGTQGLGLVEVAGEADLIARLEARRIVPCVRCMGQHFAANEGLNSSRLQ